MVHALQISLLSANTLPAFRKFIKHSVHSNETRFLFYPNIETNFGYAMLNTRVLFYQMAFSTHRFDFSIDIKKYKTFDISRIPNLTGPKHCLFFQTD